MERVLNLLKCCISCIMAYDMVFLSSSTIKGYNIHLQMQSSKILKI